MGRSTVCGIVRETCDVLWQVLAEEYVSAPSSAAELVRSFISDGTFHIVWVRSENVLYDIKYICIMYFLLQEQLMETTL